MASPIWITPAGSLGTIPDQEFYQFLLEVYNPIPPTPVTGTLNFTQMSKTVTGNGTHFIAELSPGERLFNNDGVNLGIVTEIIDDVTLKIYQEALNTEIGTVVFRAETVQFDVISGTLPLGLHLDQFGNMFGVPINGELEGVPAAITKVTTNTFTVRAKNSLGALADRTFSITVAGVNPPVISPKDVSLGEYFDGDLFSVQLQAANFTPSSLTWSLVSGALPPGVTLSPTGLIQGFIEPATPAEGAQQGFDASQYDRYVYDFFGLNISKNYQFTVMVSDEFTADTSDYTIYVYDKKNMTADSDKLTADNESMVDVSVDTRHTPILRNLDTTLEPVRQGGYHAFKFDGYDFDGDELVYTISDGNLPAGLAINPGTGWLTGLIPQGPLGQVNYSFTVRVAKSSYPTYYTEREYIIPLLGQINNTVIWDTSAFLGEIDNGSISTLNIQAHTESGRKLQYRVWYDDPYNPSFTGSRLPQGLVLLPDGSISGRTSFEMFTLDRGYTTYDHGATTFDYEFKFTVEAYDSDNYVSGTKDFTIKVNNTNIEPYENLYIRALPTREQRIIYEQIINNSDIFPVNDIYRASDPWFGKNTDIKCLFLTGISTQEVSAYVEALSLNHYWKTLAFGDVKTAQALDENFNIKYEVVYVDLIDRSVNEKGQSPSANIAINPNTEHITNVYPNSFTNMANRIINGVGYANKSILPEWMISRQKDGRVLGFTRSLVLCYCKPGTSSAIAYRVRAKLDDLRLVDFTIDRYEWDSYLSANYNKATRAFETEPETTFDRELYTGCTGTISTISGSATVSGVDTEFMAQLMASNTDPVGSLLFAEIVCSGTITASADSRVVTGNNTAFTTELSEGDFVVANDSYTINGETVNSYTRLGQVVEITSDTSLILANTAAENINSKDFSRTLLLGKVGAISSNHQLTLETSTNSTTSDVSFGMYTQSATMIDLGDTRFFTDRVGYTDAPSEQFQYLKFPDINISTRSLSS